MKMRLFEDYVALKERPLETIKEGIAVATDRDEENNVGIVVVTGPMATRCAVDDQVLFKRHMFDQVSIDGEVYFIGSVQGIYGAV